MKKIIFASIIFLIWVNIATAGTIGSAVEVSIITDNGLTLPLFPVKIRPDLKKVYAEAFKGDHYTIVVRNNLNRRVGVVVAVDGRNIISGQKSRLKNTERMYVIDAYSTNEYTGWRTAQNKINRFYFTDVPDSYAAAFGDESAMGVIAVVAYPEIQLYEPQSDCFSLNTEKKSREQARDRAAAPVVKGKDKASESAGTGYGREEYSPSYRVQFNPENRAVESILIKYEWHKTLCKMNIINCSKANDHPYNRIWDNDGYAPAPPNRR